MTAAPKPKCPGCDKDTDRAGGLCGFCRAAVVELRPARKAFNANTALTEVRRLSDQWVVTGLTSQEVDALVTLITEIDTHITEGGYPPDDWDGEVGWEETPVPVKRTQTVKTDLL
jgi:hypothetical protein